VTLETIISAIGLVLNLLMDIPSATVASSEAKKARAAKILAKLVKQLDEIILRGHKILSVLDTLPDTLNTKSKINDVCDELEELLESQKIALNQIASDIQIDFFVNDDIKNSAGIKFQKNNTELHKILTIYESEGVKIWGPALAGKRWMMSAFHSEVLENIEKLELELDDPHRIIPYIALSDYLGFNFSSAKDRNKYIREARKRLKAIEEGRANLSKLIQQHYEPHHLL
jgi:hypothetical protein